MAIDYALNSEVCEVETARVKVLTEGYARGLTLNVDEYDKDYLNPIYAENTVNKVIVAKDVNARAFIEKFLSVFR